MPATIEPSKEEVAAATDRRRTEMREQLIAMRREEAAAEDDDDFAWFEDARTQLLPGSPAEPSAGGTEPSWFESARPAESGQQTEVTRPVSTS